MEERTPTIEIQSNGTDIIVAMGQQRISMAEADFHSRLPMMVERMGGRVRLIGSQSRLVSMPYVEGVEIPSCPSYRLKAPK